MQDLWTALQKLHDYNVGNHSGFDRPRDPDGTAYPSSDFAKLNGGARIEMSSSRPHSLPDIVLKYSGCFQISGRDFLTAARVLVSNVGISS